MKEAMIYTPGWFAKEKKAGNLQHSWALAGSTAVLHALSADQKSPSIN
jgi:hypothetical protein